MKNKVIEDFSKDLSKDVSINVDVIKFEDDDCFYSSIPSLDITGYGRNRKEADQSLEIMLAEFFEYTENNNTLNKELIKLGWKLEKKIRKFSAPDFLSSISKSKVLKEIVNKRAFRKDNKKLRIPDACLQD